MNPSNVQVACAHGQWNLSRRVGEAVALSTVGLGQASVTKAGRQAGNVDAGRAGGGGDEAIRASIPTLPTELLDLIFNHLDERELAACCLVSHTFAALVRPHLYSQIIFQLFHTEETPYSTATIDFATPRLFALYHTLLDRPDLAQLVRTIWVEPVAAEFRHVLCAWKCDRSTLSDFTSRWLMAKRLDVGLLLSRLSNLEELFINDVSDLDSGEKRGFSPHVAAYLQGLHFPKLENLGVPAIPPFLSALAPNLRTLSSDMEFRTFAGLYGNYPPPPLDWLVLDEPFSWPEDAPAREAWDWLVSSSFSSLTHLDIYCKEGFSPSYSAFTALSTLILHLQTGTYPFDHSASGPLFRLPPSLRSLKVLDLDSDIYERDDDAPQVKTRDVFLGHLPRGLRKLSLPEGFVEREALVEALSQRDVFLPVLGRFSISDWSGEVADDEELQKRCEEKGILYG
ncbi:hypothetical protein JCM10213_003818 [Rhodosporidiobolus nylandii]